MAPSMRRIKDDMLQALDQYKIAKDSYWTTEQTYSADENGRQRAFRKMQALSDEVTMYAAAIQALKGNHG